MYPEFNGFSVDELCKMLSASFYFEGGDGENKQAQKLVSELQWRIINTGI